MKYAVSSLVAAAALLALAGCSTLAGSSDAGENGIDVEKVARIEGAAQRYGTRVIWLNMPRKAPSRQTQN